MIDIMIESVVLEKQYEFKLDENVPVFDLMEDISEMICQRERCEIKGSWCDLMLYSKNHSTVLPGNATLASCGIHTGDILYFA